VTPAPRRRSTFWGEEREQGMPPAEGVPDQADWVSKITDPTFIL
jgi:glycogenin glucosyltransferase